NAIEVGVALKSRGDKQAAGVYVVGPTSKVRLIEDAVVEHPDGQHRGIRRSSRAGDALSARPSVAGSLAEEEGFVEGEDRGGLTGSVGRLEGQAVIAELQQAGVNRGGTGGPATGDREVLDTAHRTAVGQREAAANRQG